MRFLNVQMVNTSDIQSTSVQKWYERIVNKFTVFKYFQMHSFVSDNIDL